MPFEGIVPVFFYDFCEPEADTIAFLLFERAVNQFLAYSSDNKWAIG